jgi:hypothetical protein
VGNRRILFAGQALGRLTNPRLPFCDDGFLAFSSKEGEGASDKL